MKLRCAAALGVVFFCMQALAIPISGKVTWETTLQARDIDGDGIVDAYFDTSSNLT